MAKSAINGRIKAQKLQVKGISLRKDAESVLQAYQNMKSYRIQENLLMSLLKEYPDHRVKDAVEVKVKLLNLFYSTGIQATNAMAANIVNIKNIDTRLAEGDISLINEIATLKLKDITRYNYSFATKYCAYHQPKLYPIYDSIVADTLVSFFEKGLLPKYELTPRKSKKPNAFTKGEFAQNLKQYNFFVEVYRYFMERFDLQNLTYRQVDSYIWGAFKVGGEDFEIEKMAQLNKKTIIEYMIPD